MNLFAKCVNPKCQAILFFSMDVPPRGKSISALLGHEVKRTSGHQNHEDTTAK